MLKHNSFRVFLKLQRIKSSEVYTANKEKTYLGSVLCKMAADSCFEIVLRFIVRLSNKITMTNGSKIAHWLRKRI